jgi:hypothetical protein
MNCESAPTQPSIESGHVRLPTQHGLMVAWGQFAQDIGLIEGLMDVPVPQKMVRHAPQKKLLEFQMAILAGVEYLQDINAGPIRWLEIGLWPRHGARIVWLTTVLSAAL